MILLNPKCSLVDFFTSLATGEHAMLILDYDGTLAPFSHHPNLAYPYPGVFDRIKKLMETKKTNVVIVSGRSIESLKAVLPPPFPELWGCHGGERLKVDAKHLRGVPLKQEVASILKIAAQQAATLTPQLPLEEKPYSVALHWRGRDVQAVDMLKARWQQLTLHQPLEIHPFDGGMELRVRGINKGGAVRQLLQEFSGKTIAYLGDDLTDEQAFEVLQDRALKILVRKELRPTLADLCLQSPKEVLTFLDSWLQAIKEGEYGRAHS